MSGAIVVGRAMQTDERPVIADDKKAVSGLLYQLAVALNVPATKDAVFDEIARLKQIDEEFKKLSSGIIEANVG